tara:strand:+ start:300 stop:491 length:192 start_codon:yes stop_codon:yes gene_type:complete
VISTIFFGLGLILLIEGLVYVLAPHFVEKMLVTLKDMSYEKRRLFGACMALLGGLILLFVKML